MAVTGGRSKNSLFYTADDIILLKQVQNLNPFKGRGQWSLVAQNVNTLVNRDNFNISDSRARARTLHLFENFGYQNLVNKQSSSNTLTSSNGSKADSVEDSHEVKLDEEEKTKHELLKILVNDNVMQMFEAKKPKKKKIGGMPTPSNTSEQVENTEMSGKESENREGFVDQPRNNKSTFLVKCPMYCRLNCASKHHPLLVALLNCKDTTDEQEMQSKLQQLEHVVQRYESSGKWEKDDPIPDSTESYQYPMLHWACALGFINAAKWLIQHGMSKTSRAESFGNETALQKALLCLQETSPNDCFDKFEQVVEVLEPTLFETDSLESTVLHTCCEYLSNDIPKFMYFQHCMLTIVFFLRTKKMDSELRQLIEAQNIDGNTCLHILCRSDKCYMSVRSLLKETINQRPIVTIMRNLKEFRPIDVAYKNGCSNIYAYLSKFNKVDTAADLENPQFDEELESWKAMQYVIKKQTDKAGTDAIIRLQDNQGMNRAKSNVVYDRRGNVIGEKLELKPEKRSANKRANSSVSQQEEDDDPEIESITIDTDLNDLPPEKRTKVGHASEIKETEKLTWENKYVKLPTKGSPYHIDILGHKIKTERSAEESTSNDSVTNLPAKLKLARLMNESSQSTGFWPKFNEVKEPDFRQFEEFFKQNHSDSQKMQFFEKLKKHYDYTEQQFSLMSGRETDLNAKFEMVQDGQMKVVVEVQKLLKKRSLIRRQDKNLMVATYNLNNEINTTQSTHQGLTERLQHCKAALAVLHDIYQEPNEEIEPEKSP